MLKDLRFFKDFPKPGINYIDIQGLFLNPESHKDIVNNTSIFLKEFNINKLIAIESRGFLIGSSLSYSLGIPLVIVRKQGKLPGNPYVFNTSSEYSDNNCKFEIDLNLINKNDRIVIVDDVLATGKTLCSVANAINDSTNLVGFSTIINIKDLENERTVFNNLLQNSNLVYNSYLSV